MSYLAAMAKVGEGDPRWVVADRPDGKNVNAWHWSERDVSSWAKAYLTSRLSAVSFPGADAGGGGDSTLTVDKVEGDAHLYNRKGTLKSVYDLKVSGKWRTAHADAPARTSGTYTFELFDDDPHVSFTLDSTSAAVVAERDAARSAGTPAVRAVCGDFIAALGAGADVAGAAGTPAVAPATSAAATLAALPPPPTFDDSAAVDLDAPPPDSVTASVLLAARRADVYGAFTDPGRVRAYSQRPAVVGGGVGSDWSIAAGPFESSGTVVEATPPTSLVLTWRLAAWPADTPDSRVALSIADEDGKVRLSVAHTAIPPGQRGAVEAWWRGEVFRRVKVVFGWGDASFL
ncbi:hypothetical protein I4F81_006582 [Pyropia yezoensis]|uniref:Uncharacterized protein n=1 Tax=Pyropia yezoensis TaxID=2788 RepID=A0ACC3C166_PYRYE|nr:hypothetical protein I4F81_006582 [Neopyropia yezoensis]